MSHLRGVVGAVGAQGALKRAQAQALKRAQGGLKGPRPFRAQWGPGGPSWGRRGMGQVTFFDLDPAQGPGGPSWGRRGVGEVTFFDLDPAEGPEAL